MRRHLILGLLLSLFSLFSTGAAHAAACPGIPSNCGDPMQTTTSGSVMYAKAFGVKADGVTSDDVALKGAVDACNAIGGKLLLPPGKPLLDGTGGQPITVNNCAIAGTDVPGLGGGAGITTGTTFLLTSTTVKPFILGSNVAFIGVNFYYPNQTNGTTVYPPLFSDDGNPSGDIGEFYFENVTIINPYIGFQQTNFSWANLILSNSTLYAVKDGFQLKTTGGSFVMNNVLLGPGPWVTINPAAKTNGAANAAAAANTLLHVTANGGTGGVTISTRNMNTFAWRTAIKIDAGGTLSNSVMNWNFDGIGTLVDTSAGGNYAFQNVLTGFNSNCGIVVFPAATGVGNTPCFDLGNTGNLNLDGFNGGTSRGDYIRTSGTSVRIRNSYLGGIGQAADGGDYYMIHVTGGSSIAIDVKNSAMGGNSGDAHVHGIVVEPAASVAVLDIQSNSFGQFNDVITAKYGSDGTHIIGNSSVNTTGSSSVNLSGPGSVSWVGNQFDKAPKATVTSCGSGATIQGTLRGTIATGTGTVTTCTLHLPITPYSANGNGACTFSNTTALVTGGSTGLPPTWALSSGSSNIAGQQLTFNCGSE